MASLGVSLRPRMRLGRVSEGEERPYGNFERWYLSLVGGDGGWTFFQLLRVCHTPPVD